jgi:hypothetical protein
MLCPMKKRHIGRAVGIVVLGAGIAAGIYAIKQSSSTNTPTYTFAQVQAADRFQQCLMIMGDGVYDITPSVAELPALRILCGTDATNRVDQLGVPLKETFSAYYAGKLVD